MKAFLQSWGKDRPVAWRVSKVSSRVSVWVWLTACLLFIMSRDINSVSAEEQKATSDPGKIVISDQDIKKMNVHSVVELLNQIPGVSATETSVNFRGASTSEILVLLDGRTINDLTSSWRAVNWNQISLGSIEKIEIFKGTGSVLYGDNSSGGVISITTRKIARGSHGNIEVSYGRFDSQEYDLNYQQEIRNLGLGLSAGWEKTDGFRVNSNKEHKRLSTKLSYGFDQRKSAIFSFDYSQLEKGSPGKTYFPTPRATADEENWGATFLYPLGRLKTGTHYSNFKKEYKNPDTGFLNIMESWAVDEEISSTISAGRLGRFNIGTDIEVAHVKGNKITPRQEEKCAFYTTKDIRLENIPLTLGLGLRANIYSDFPNVINPQIQLSYSYYNTDMQLSISRSNNIPTFYKRYYETTTLKSNPDLGMEKATNYSLSFSSQFKERLEGGISLFFSKISDRICYAQEGNIARYKNIGSVTRKGIDTSVKWRPNNFWQINGSHTYLVAKDEDTGKYVTYSPKHRLNLDIQYKPLKNVSLGLYTKYISKRFLDTDNTKILRGRYFRSDFRGDYSLKERIRFFFKIENIFNKDYDVTDGYPCTPRTWTAGMNYEF